MLLLWTNMDMLTGPGSDPVLAHYLHQLGLFVRIWRPLARLGDNLRWDASHVSLG